jgi:polyhydroxyalkanoate synthesis regulator phasin
MRKAGGFKQVLIFDKNVMESFQNLTESSGRVYSMVTQGDMSSFENEVESLRRDIKNMINEFSHRRI